MADYRTKEIKEARTGVDSSGSVVEERIRSVETEIGSKARVVNVIWYIYGLIAVLLGLRMVLKLFGANSGNAFVEFIYSTSGVLSAPFDSIFGVTQSEAGSNQAVFEPSILVAIAVYGLIAWGIAKLVVLNEKEY
ncbi:TPA: hypothetical protein EYO12_03660 [Candidatus Saccharibacteria bacterium]|nr:hypothetical protein [Candidatus Saccharibacteria bacterium]HIO87872.1 hypothetical protein [Candidatus Saccharibacteria bacterium]